MGVYSLFPPLHQAILGGGWEMRESQSIYTRFRVPTEGADPPSRLRESVGVETTLSAVSLPEGLTGKRVRIEGGVDFTLLRG